DITEMKRREQDLAEKTQLLQATLDNMQQGLLVLDPDLRIKAWNNRLLALLEIDPEEARPGQHVVEVLRAIGRRGEYGQGEIERIVTERVDQLQRLEPARLERLRPDGTILEQRRVRMPDGGILMTYNDVTESKRVEADLRRAKDEAELASRSK